LPSFAPKGILRLLKSKIQAAGCGSLGKVGSGDDARVALYVKPSDYLDGFARTLGDLVFVRDVCEELSEQLGDT
jgi:hypothetical protein